MGQKRQPGALQTRTKLPTLTESQTARLRDPRQPLWEPEEAALNAVPAEVQQTMQQILRPFYEQFVTGARDGLEQSLAMTLVHLMWLEVLDQFDTKQIYTKLEAPFHLPGNYAAKIDQHLRVLDSKVKVGYLLAHLRQCLQRDGETLLPLPEAAPATEEESPKLLTFQALPTANSEATPETRIPRVTKRRRTTGRDASVSESLSPGQWQEIRGALSGLLQEAYEEADAEERQGKRASRVAESLAAPRTP